MKKFLTFLIILAIAGAAGYYYYRQREAKIQAANAAAMSGPQAIKVERGNIDLQVPTTGKVVSNLDVEIKSKASGTIVKLPYDISDKVSSGALLAQLDPIDEERNVAQAHAQYQAAQARLNQAQENLKIAQSDVDTGTSTALAALQAARVKFQENQAKMARQQDLYKKHLVSSEDVDISRSDLSSSENALRQAEINVAELKNLPRTVELRKQDILLNESSLQQSKISLDNAEQRLKETKIYAPMDGVITSRPVQTGMIIASGISNVGGGTSLMTLSDLSHIYVMANVDESDIGKIKTGQKAVITADAYPGKRFRGTVVRVATKGETNSNVVTFEVKIEIEGEGKNLLKPEMTANVDVQADRRENALLLPNETIQFGHNGYYVLKADDEESTPTRVSVKTGITDGLNTEIVSGLKEGDKVFVPSTMQSRWAKGGDPGPGGGQNFSRGMQRAAFGLSRGRRGRR